MKKTSRHTALKKILADIAGNIDIDLFNASIGRKMATFLLVYMAGLIICRKYAAMTKIERILRVCKHDALLQMLNAFNIPLHIISGIFTRWIQKHRRTKGWLCLDDTVIVKEYSKDIQCAGYTWVSSVKRSVMGIHVVALYWSDGRYRIPVGFRIHLPKEKTKNYRTKNELAREILSDNLSFCQTCAYLAFDNWYCAKETLAFCHKMNLHCSSRLRKNRIVVFQRRKISVSQLPKRFCQAELPGYGPVMIYRDRCHGKDRYLMCTDLFVSESMVKKRYNSRWRIEEAFRFIKQDPGFGACQCRKNTPVSSHIAIVFLTHFVVESQGYSNNITPQECCMNIFSDFLNLERNLPSLRERRKALEWNG